MHFRVRLQCMPTILYVNQILDGHLDSCLLDKGLTHLIYLRRKIRVYSGIGLWYRPARLHRLAGRYGNPSPESSNPPLRDYEFGYSFEDSDGPLIVLLMSLFLEWFFFCHMEKCVLCTGMYWNIFLYIQGIQKYLFTIEKKSKTMFFVPICMSAITKKSGPIPILSEIL